LVCPVPGAFGAGAGEGDDDGDFDVPGFLSCAVATAR
jgi:hypothetical protein